MAGRTRKGKSQKRGTVSGRLVRLFRRPEKTPSENNQSSRMNWSITQVRKPIHNSKGKYLLGRLMANTTQGRPIRMLSNTALQNKNIRDLLIPLGTNLGLKKSKKTTRTRKRSKSNSQAISKPEAIRRKNGPKMQKRAVSNNGKFKSITHKKKPSKEMKVTEL